MGRKKSSNQELEKYSEGRLRTEFSSWILNSHQDEDFGFDYNVQVTDPNSGLRDITSYQFYLQLKASEVFDNDESVYWDIDVDYIVDDCLSSNIPVVLLIYERENDEFYWCILQTFFWDTLNEKQNEWREQETVRVRIDREQRATVEDSELFYSSDCQPEFLKKIDRAQERISFRQHVNTIQPDSQPKIDYSESQLADSSEISAYKREQLEHGRELLSSGSLSQALSILLDVYNMPEWDIHSVEAIVELLKARDITHPVIAFAQYEFAETGLNISSDLDYSKHNDFLKKHKKKAENAIVQLMIGARFNNTDIQEEFIILDINDLSPDNTNRSF